MLERMLVEHAAPTLARVKTGSLVQLPLRDEQAFRPEYEALRLRLAPKGVQLRLYRMRGRALVYLFRPDRLQKTLACPRVQALLGQYGYDAFTAEEALDRLGMRLEASEDFPHEIGVFLGYPIDDVESFIEHGGRNFAACGCWKAYHNVCEARRIFAWYAKCRDVYTRLYRDGRSIDRLTVAA